VAPGQAGRGPGEFCIAVMVAQDDSKDGEGEANPKIIDERSKLYVAYRDGQYVEEV